MGTNHCPPICGVVPHAMRRQVCFLAFVETPQSLTQQGKEICLREGTMMPGMLLFFSPQREEVSRGIDANASAVRIIAAPRARHFLAHIDRFARGASRKRVDSSVWAWVGGRSESESTASNTITSRARVGDSNPSQTHPLAWVYPVVNHPCRKRYSRHQLARLGWCHRCTRHRCLLPRGPPTAASALYGVKRSANHPNPGSCAGPNSWGGLVCLEFQISCRREVIVRFGGR